MLPLRAQGAGELAPFITTGKTEALAMVRTGYKKFQGGCTMKWELLLLLCCGLLKAMWLLSAMAFEADCKQATSPSMPGDKTLGAQHKG